MTRYTFSLLFNSLEAYMSATAYVFTIEARNETFARIAANYKLPAGVSCDHLIEAVEP